MQLRFPSLFSKFCSKSTANIFPKTRSINYATFFHPNNVQNAESNENIKKKSKNKTRSLLKQKTNNQK